MNPGDFKHKAIFYTPVYELNSLGERVVQYNQETAKWCSLEKQEVKDMSKSDLAASSLVLTFRYSTLIQPNVRFKFKDEIYFVDTLETINYKEYTRVYAHRIEDLIYE